MANTSDGQADSLYSYDSFFPEQKTSDSKFFLWCAGRIKKLLKEFPVRTYPNMRMGGVIWPLFVLAALSSVMPSIVCLQYWLDDCL